ncbi:MAG: translation initiation factor IF-3, partial [Candidatus Omnitrophota bacterium]|nr:translation initiation factor IF-3 [Candidatus Omnitrophota bacterium]
MVAIKKFIRINERINVAQVRVIGHDGSQLGVMSVQRALEIAGTHDLDLVEVAPTAAPPVCRIIQVPGRIHAFQGAAMTVGPGGPASVRRVGELDQGFTGGTHEGDGLSRRGESPGERTVGQADAGSVASDDLGPG